MVTFLLCPIQIVRSQSGADADFGEAYEHYTHRRYSAAKPLLQSAIAEKNSVLRDYSLYYLGRVAMALNTFEVEVPDKTQPLLKD